MPKHVLLVEDNQWSRKGLERILAAEGILTHAYESGEKALIESCGHHFDAMVLDLHLPGMRGDDLATILSQVCDCDVIIFVTSEWGSEQQLHARFPRCHVFAKPFRIADLMEAIDRGNSN